MMVTLPFNELITHFPMRQNNRHIEQSYHQDIRRWIRNEIADDKFHVKSTLKYLDTIRQCGGCSDAVFTRIISSREAFRELLPTLANFAILTKQGNVYMCV